MAAQQNSLELLDILCNFPIDVNIKNRVLIAPIYYAVENKNLEFVKRLIQMGADLNMEDKNGSTCFYWAVYMADLPTLKYLHEKGAKLMIKNHIARSPLIKASFLNKPDIVEWLLQFPETIEYINAADLK